MDRVLKINKSLKNCLKVSLGSLLPKDHRLEGLRFSQSLYAKLGVGYLGAIAIAVAGSLIGLVGADYYQGKGIEQLFDAQEQVRLLDELQYASSEVRFQGLRLDVRTRQSQEQRQRLREFEQMRERAIVASEATIQFVEADPDWLATDRDGFIALMTVYAEATVQYHAALAQFLEQVESPTLSEVNGEVNGEVNVLQSRLALIQRGEHLARLEALSLEVEALRRQAEEQAISSGDRMETIQGYEKLAIIMSLLFSSGLAAWMAWRTTRRIATPIAEAASLAQRVASEDDYSLRLPVTTDDEVGLLVNSLNYLIERIELRSQQLRTSANNARNKANELQLTLADLEDTQSQLIQSEKMSSLGQLVAGIAHEINNPTSFIYGNIGHARDYFSDLLGLLNAYRHRYPDNEELNSLAEELDFDFTIDDIQKLMDSMETGARRISEIVRSLRTFSRLDEAELKQVDLHEGIDSTLTILNTRFRMFPHTQPLKLVKDYGELPLIECHSTQINQVVMNLIVNAIDALEDAVVAGKWDHVSSLEGEVLKDAKSIPEEPCLTIRTRDRRDGWIAVEISDNALGIPETARAKLFDPFFTTKAIGRGTGLGLSICYKIITETHRGQLTYDTEIGHGTTFEILLLRSLTV
jgi:two-component system NtrC family sensor kinase